MSRPLPMPLPVPSWATTPDSPNIPPDADQRLDGWVPGEKPPAQVFNYIQKEYYDWIRYLDDMSTQFDAFREGAQSNPVTNAASAIATGLPAPIMVQSSAQGTGSTLAKNDHRHPVSIGVPVDIGSSNAEGTATSLSRSDHRHWHGPLVQSLYGNRLAARGSVSFTVNSSGQIPPGSINKYDLFNIDAANLFPGVFAIDTSTTPDAALEIMIQYEDTSSIDGVVLFTFSDPGIVASDFTTLTLALVPVSKPGSWFYPQRMIGDTVNNFYRCIFSIYGNITSISGSPARYAFNLDSGVRYTAHVMHFMT